MSHVSDEEPLDGRLQGLDLRPELRALFNGDGGGDDGPGHATRATQGLLGAHEDVRDVLVLAQQRQVEDDLQRLCVRRHHDELRDPTVQGFGGWKQWRKR